MAKTFDPIFIKNVDLVLGDPVTGDNFKCQLRSINLDPDTNIVKIKTACPEGQYAQVEDPEWTLGLGYLAGNMVGTGTGPAALTEFLFDHKGEQMPFLFRPKSGGAGWSGTVTVVAGGVGGDVGGYSEKTVSLALTGQPAKLAAAA